MPTVHPVLAPYVRAIHVYDVEYDGPGVHIGMPSTELTWVLPLDEPLAVSWDGAPDTRTTAWTSVSGLHTRAAAVHHGDRQRGIQLALTTAGARALFGTPAAALAGHLLELSDVAPGLADLPEQVAAAPSWTERVEILQGALVRSLHRLEQPAPRGEVARAMALLTRGVTVAATADDVGYSRRRLSTLVRDEVGLAPKAYQRLARFTGAHERLRRAAATGEVSVAAVAAASGYADQAHLAREWAGFAGCSPTEWVRREFPIVQASGVLDTGR
ncbi:AraC-type DNA-binding protein [Nocardioides alpinus]|uniref:AraC family transcriptional regulator n=1 Tax=Nocardioides alpinus TaxID=748909 RepID=A0A1I1BEJ9_9ACTN|nr:AraC family transcriptional regulator [Nocardioides alpinus]PKH39856.1 AraC family transcriptional regulator [Nocardioides alpinus]SFB48805.1 AraC-type DNA-binding protein [Nocardioides alpinus]